MSAEAAVLVRQLVATAHLPEGSGVCIVIDPQHQSLSMSRTRGPEPQDDVVSSGDARAFLSQPAIGRRGTRTLHAEMTAVDRRSISAAERRALRTRGDSAVGTADAVDGWRSQHPRPAERRRRQAAGTSTTSRPLRDVQIAARHADPRTTTRYDRARANLDRHGNYILSAFTASPN